MAKSISETYTPRHLKRELKVHRVRLHTEIGRGTQIGAGCGWNPVDARTDKSSRPMNAILAS